MRFVQISSLIRICIERCFERLISFEYLESFSELHAKRTDMLTVEEQKRIRNIKIYVERIILNQLLLVATTGCLTDRINSWNRDRTRISTVIIDKAGQLMQARLVHGFNASQFRTVLLGDHQQLRPHSDSHSAKMAGLGLSAMHWILLGYCELE